MYRLQFHKQLWISFLSYAENKFAVGSSAKTVCVCYYEEDNNWYLLALVFYLMQDPLHLVSSEAFEVIVI